MCVCLCVRVYSLVAPTTMMIIKIRIAVKPGNSQVLNLETADRGSTGSDGRTDKQTSRRIAVKDTGKELKTVA